MRLVAAVPLILLKQAAKEVVLGNPELFRFHDEKSGTVQVPVESPAFDHLIAVSREVSGLRFSPFIEIRESDTRKSELLRLRPAKIVRENVEDNAVNTSDLSRVTPKHSASGFLTKQLHSVTLSRFKLGARDFAGIDEWTNSFVVGHELVRELGHSKLRGLTLGTVRDQKGSDRQQLLVTDVTMQEADLSAGAERIFDRALGVTTVRWNACMVYESPGPLIESDVARSAEPENLHLMPVWLVSASFYRWYRNIGARGLRFEPVLIKGSEAFLRQEREWNRFLELLASNSSNRIW